MADVHRYSIDPFVDIDQMVYIMYIEFGIDTLSKHIQSEGHQVHVACASHDAAKKLAAFGPKEVLLTHRGGVLVYHDGGFHEAPWVAQAVRGRSGRGDTCTASYLSRRLSAPPEDAVVWAAAVTSLKLEAEGPFRRTKADAQALYERLKSKR